MKKFSLIMCITILSVMVLTGCANESEEPADITSDDETTNVVDEPTPEIDEINIGVLMGPTAMGMVGVMDEADNGNIEGITYNFTLAPVDEIMPALVQGNLDIAAVPSNLASVLHNNTEGEIQVIAINTLGVLSVVEDGDTVTSVEDLRGKTIYASGNSATPEFVLNYILEGNGIDPQNDVTIEWLSEQTEVVSRVAMSENAIAMLPQPFVTIAQNENEDLRIALDLTEEWDRVQANSSDQASALITGVLVARREFLEQNPVAVSNFLDHYTVSVAFVNNNIEAAADLIGYYDIFPAPVAARALPHSNITFIEGAEMKGLLSGYLRVLFEQNPESIGGEMPDDDFYFIR